MGSLCRDCYVEVHGIASIPDRVSFVYCRYCGRFKYMGGWNEPTGDSIEETIRDYLLMHLSRKMKPTQGLAEAWIEDIRLLRPYTGPGIYRVSVSLAGRSPEGVLVSEDRIIELKVDVGVCPLCTNRVTKRGYEAILQVRSSSGRLSEDLRNRVDSFLQEELSNVLRESIIGVEEHKEGFDLLLADPTSARIIASKLRSAFMAKTIETYKLIGRKPDGSRKGRLTISVRIPDISPGDIIRVGGRLHLFLATARGGSPLLVDLETGREFTARPDYLWRRGFEEYEGGIESRKLMLLSNSGSILFADASTGYADIIDFPREKVRVFVDDFTPGRLYKVLIVSGRAYVIDYVDEEVESNG